MIGGVMNDREKHGQKKQDYRPPSIWAAMAGLFFGEQHPVVAAFLAHHTQGGAEAACRIARLE